MSHDRRLRRALSIALARALFLVCLAPGTTPAEDDPRDSSVEPAERQATVAGGAEAVYLDQGWTADERHDFYYLTQGSQLVPYYWFLWLELPNREELFRSDHHMRSLGYIPQPPEPRRNPDGLPIGFVKDDNPETVETSYAMKKAFLGPNYEEENYPPDNVWLGLTCAACHTAELAYHGRTIRIDGGSALVDHERFLGELAAALRATHGDDDKFTRLAKRVLDTGYNPEEAAELRKRVDAYTRVLERLVERNQGEHPYGPARLDAFGAILNQVCETALGIPENHEKANAPVSFPFLWDAPHLDWVQWNASAANPLERNVGEVLGVYAHAKLTGTPAEGQFTSTVRIDNLFRLEESLAKLKAPAWPADIFGAIDGEKAELGRRLFAANCAGCHGVRDESGQFPMTPPNADGKQFIRTTVVHHAEIGTDPQMVLNFVGRTAKPGALAPFLPEPFRGMDKVPAAVLLKVAVRGAIQNRLAGFSPPLDREQLAVLNGHREPNAVPPERGAGYKARPLNGIWATAPYLHSGAVPNLYQLLLPEDERVTSFYVGNREFDPVNVGFRTEPFEGGFEFRTRDAAGNPIPGNSNAGHSGPGHTDFTDEERRALVEYMKTLR